MSDGALDYAMILLKGLPDVLQVGSSVVQAIGMIQMGIQRIQTMRERNRPPSTEEWDELNRTIAQLRSALHEGEQQQPQGATMQTPQQPQQSRHLATQEPTPTPAPSPAPRNPGQRDPGRKPPYIAGLMIDATQSYQLQCRWPEPGDPDYVDPNADVNDGRNGMSARNDPDPGEDPDTVRRREAQANRHDPLRSETHAERVVRKEEQKADMVERGSYGAGSEGNNDDNLDGVTDMKPNSDYDNTQKAISQDGVPGELHGVVGDNRGTKPR